MTFYIKTTRGRVAVNVNVRHMEAHPGVVDVLQEALYRVGTVDANATFIRTAVRMKTTGISECVAAPAPPNEQFFVVRPGRLVPSRVVYGDGVEVDVMTVILGRRDTPVWSLYTAYWGDLAPKEPHDRSLRNDSVGLKESLDFWNVHALAVPPGTKGVWASSWANVLESIHTPSGEQARALVDSVVDTAEPAPETHRGMFSCWALGDAFLNVSQLEAVDKLVPLSTQRASRETILKEESP